MDDSVIVKDSDSKIVLRGSITGTSVASTLDELSDPEALPLRTEEGERSLVIANQPRASSRKTAGASFHSPFNDAHSERAWGSPLCKCGGENRSSCAMFWCWPIYRYMLATRVGETPFMPLIPCAAFALRVKIRTLFGIKGNLIKDFFTTLCCEPCAVCQMVREMDLIGL